MIKAVFVTILVLVAVSLSTVLGLAALKPDTFHVRRAAIIKAPPEKIFPAINDFRRWGAWSPYESKDPGMKRSYSGGASGKGAVYAWEGDGNVGTGRMEIVDAIPPFKIALKLDFDKPFEAHNVVEFTLEPRGGSTEVTWSMHGPAPLPAKIAHVFFDMDDVVGRDFETGLANLKAVSER